MLSIAFHYDPETFDHFAHLVDAFCVDDVYVVDMPVDYEAPRWTSVQDVDAIDNGCVHVVVAPKTAVHQPGETELHSFDHPEDVLYIFGADNCHNEAVACEASVYIDVPHAQTPFYAAQAALLTLYDRWYRGNR